MWALPPQNGGTGETNASQARKAEARRFLAKRGLFGLDGAELRKRAREARATLTVAPQSGLYAPALLNQPWQAVGPAQVSTAAYGNVTGRVTSIAADPADPTGNTVYLGTTGGGVWKSTNAAGPAASVVFTPLTDDLPVFSSGNLASLSIGAVSVQPGNTGVLLAGTGDPNDALDSYYGTGLLRSGDRGLTWSLIVNSGDLPLNGVTDFYFLGLAFSGFAWSSQSPNLVVAAVSQSAEGVVVGANEKEIFGGLQPAVMGLYYSTDAGQTWLLGTISDGPHQVVQTSTVAIGGGGNAATAVVWNPIRNRFYAAVRFHGYYESLDGITWTRLTNQPGSGLTTTECPTNPGGVGSVACPIFRGALAVQPVTGDMFALTVDVNLLDQGLWQDTCSATFGSCASSTVTFARQLNSVPLDDPNNPGTIAQGDYNLWLAAAQVTGDTLLFAGTTDIYRCSVAAGCAFRNTTNTATCGAAQVAPFQHAVDATFAGPLSLMYFGSDSGLCRSTDNVNQTEPPCSSDDARHYQNLNGGLGSLGEVQSFSQDPGNSAIFLAGLGVNGTAASTTPGQTVWPQVLDGYGSYVAIDPANSQNWYAQATAGVGIDVCTNGPSCTVTDFAPVIGYPQLGADAFASPEPSPFLVDSLDVGPQGSVNLIAGTCHVWRGPADGFSWSAANLLGELYPGEGPDCDGNAFIQSLATGIVVNLGGNVESIYAGMAGIGLDGPQAYSGHLFEATVSDGAPVPSSWTDLWPSPVVNDSKGFNPQDYSVSSVTVDSHDTTGQTIYATVQGFDTPVASTGSVYASTNGGASWANIRSNLPSDPVNSLAVDPNDANTVYVALDTGVYVTTAVTSCPMENCWSVYGTGLPNAPVLQLATFNQGGQALLRAGTYGRGIWQVPLITAAATVTTATAAPTTLTFPAQQVQTASAAQTVTLTNTGTIAMVVKQVTLAGDFAETDTCSVAVAVGASCSVQVTFTPTAVGSRTATLSIYVNIAGGQITVPLTGSGIPGGAIVLLPTSMNFGSGLIGVTSTPAQNVTVSNTGGVAVELETPAATGDFSITANTCSASLAPNFGCTVSLTFTPTASGPRSGVFSIADSVGTQTIPLSGVGESPATDSVSPQTLTFAPQVVGTASTAQAVTLTNSGDSPLNSIAVTVTGDFHAVDGCGNSLIGHASCSITVNYTPTAVGPEIGTLAVTDMYGKPQTIALSGVGVAPAGISVLPAAIDFGDWGVAATTAGQTVTVTNNGGVPLNGLAFAITGDFGMAGNSCASTLAAGANCAVEVTFSPAQPGPAAGKLIVSSSSAPGFEVALSGTGLSFTIQAQGASSVTVASGQTASYMLQIAPAAGSSGVLTLSCSGAPQNSTCLVNPASVQLSSGVTASVTVTIATVADTVSLNSSSGLRLSAAVLLPAGLIFFAIPWTRRRMLPLVILSFAACLALGCGVTSTGGISTAPTGGNPVSTPSATYNPLITATGPGITQSVTLTLIVD